jgi:hypothetical protein
LSCWVRWDMLNRLAQRADHWARNFKRFMSTWELIVGTVLQPDQPDTVTSRWKMDVLQFEGSTRLFFGQLFEGSTEWRAPLQIACQSHITLLACCALAKLKPPWEHALWRSVWEILTTAPTINMPFLETWLVSRNSPSPRLKQKSSIALVQLSLTKIHVRIIEEACLPCWVYFLLPPFTFNRRRHELSKSHRFKGNIWGRWQLLDFG